MAAPAGTKRKAEHEADTEELLTLRKATCEEHPHLSADAHEAVRLVIGSRAALLAGSASVVAPEFTHQQFPADLLFGYTEPALAVYYSDPDLGMAVLGAAAGTTAPVLGAGGGGATVRVPPDDVRTCLADSLPLRFPFPSSFRLLLGGQHVKALTASNFALPPDLPLSPGAEGEWRPPGGAVATYAASERSFAVHRWRIAGSEASRAYHERLQTLATWFIETASAIDVTDGKWTCYATYETLPAGGGLSLVGYATVFRFTNPVRSRPDTLRLAQLLFLPGRQRQGHGGRLLAALQADGVVVGVVGEEGTHPCAGALPVPGGRVHDVTVEAPCEGMVRLRDAFDVARGYERVAFAHVRGWDTFGPAPQGGGHPPPPDGGASLCVDLTPAELETARARLRTTPAQTLRVYHALLLSRLRREEGIARSFRLLVKRCIYESDGEVRALEAGARKEVLEDRYREVEAQLAAAAATVRVGGIGRAGVAGDALVPPEEAAAAERRWVARQAEVTAANAARGGPTYQNESSLWPQSAAWGDTADSTALTKKPVR